MFLRFFRQRNAVAERLSGVRIGCSVAGTVRKLRIYWARRWQRVSRVFWRTVEN
jgi:hypothetical protein